MFGAGLQMTKQQLLHFLTQHSSADAGRPKRSEWIRELSQAPLQGVSTLSTNVARMLERRQALIAQCLRLIRARDFTGLYRLIETDPEIALDRQIRDAVFKLGQAARYRPGPGRPPASRALHPLLIVGLVRDLIASGQAKSVAGACGVLDSMNVSTAEAARRQYYRAMAEPRYRGMSIELEQARMATTEESAAIANAESLPEGGEIRREIEVPGMGKAEIILTATEDGPTERSIQHE